MEQRAKIPPGLPRSDPTLSYWQDPPSAIAALRSTPSLPNVADYIIIGSGITGSCTAFNLLSKHPKARVVILEARGASSGATGRNGGHTKAASYRTFLAHEREHGITEAIKVARMEYANILATHAFARDYKIQCDSNLCRTADIIYSQSAFDEGCKAIARMRETMGEADPAAEYHIWNSEETRQRFHAPGAVGSFEYLAGSISAYAFTTGVLQLALSKGLNLQTHTPAERIEPYTTTALEPGNTAQTTHKLTTWTVHTARGTLSAPNLILATNGYTAHLLPQLQGAIVPLHGQIIAHRPPPALPATGAEHTYSFVHAAGYEYMITRPRGSAGEGEVVIGGGLHVLPDEAGSRYGETDDGGLEPRVSAYLRECVGRFFDAPDGFDTVAGRREWSGIMGATADGLPYVGAVPELAGLWIAAGFNGHGMVWCLKAAEALVGLMTGDEKEVNVLRHWFPQCAIVTSERLKVPFGGRKDLNVAVETPPSPGSVTSRL